MIDFEQLKIDNVNLNEKIEERNEVTFIMHIPVS